MKQACLQRAGRQVNHGRPMEFRAVLPLQGYV